MRKLHTYLFLLVFLSSPAWAATYTVTQDGSGADYSIAEFNALPGNYSDDTFYFSGTFTTKLMPLVYGTSGHNVTLDGYQAGSCNPVSDGLACSGAATIDLTEGSGRSNYGIEVTGQDYLDIQDFNIQEVFIGAVIWGGSSGVKADWVTLRRIYITDCYSGCVNVFYNTYDGDSTSGTTNVTIGGSSGNGIHCAGASSQGNSEVINIAEAQDFIFSYNTIKPALEGNYSTNILAFHSGDDILVEYNYLHNAGYGGSVISTKENGTTTDAIIRFNLLESVNNNDDTGGISFQDCTDIYFYCNMIINNDTHGTRIQENTDNIYLWSNIISNNDENGFTLVAVQETYPGTFYLYNNTFYYNCQDSDIEEEMAIRIHNINSGETGTIKNNLFIENNTLSGEPYEIAWFFQNSTQWSMVTEDYNTFYHSGETASSDMVKVDPSTYYNVSELAANDDWGSPGFVDADGADNTVGTRDDDYTLDGSYKDNGADLSQCFSVTIQGVEYAPCIDDALDPNNTDWTTTPPTVAVLNQDNYESWERGAYVFVPSSQPTAQGVSIQLQ